MPLPIRSIRPFFPEPGLAATPMLGQEFARKRDREAVERGNAEIEMKRPPTFYENADVLGDICSFLPDDDLQQAERVSRKWRNKALDCKPLRLRKYVEQHGFGAAKWERYFGKVERIRLPVKIYDVLQSPCPFFKGKTVGETHILVYVPQMVNGNPLTLNSLGELVRKPKEGSQGNPTQYTFFSNLVKIQYGTEAIKESCWILMTRDVIPESRNKSFDAQCALIPPGQGYQVPGALEAAAGVFSRCAATGERLLSDNPLTYTRCQEQVETGGWKYRVAIGGFGASGLDVHDIYLSNEHECNGVVVLRKFSGT